MYVREGVDFLGLGGLVGKPQPTVLRWTVHMLRYARQHHPQVRFHAWGQAGRKFLDAVPVYSADSSGVLGAAYRYARLRLFDPGTTRDHAVALDGGQDVLKLGGVLRRWYGVDPNDIRTSHPGNRTTLIQLAAASVQQYAAWLQRRHRVSPPTWGINPNTPPDTGARVHLVSSRAGGLTDDLETVVTGETRRTAGPPTGPRVHLVDGTPRNLTAAVNDGQ
ncbi:hypothetical protein E1211_27785 [Micromonospora sp. 15K316]|nr:hypothetical protein E1211_27785 [Micromonospora sp. 15K316]